MDTFTNGNFPNELASVATVIIYGENVTSTMNASLTQNITSMYDKITAFNELIVIEMVPQIYLDGLKRIGSKLKHLSLYSYLGDFFNNPCDLFPELEELTIDITPMSRMDLNSCRRLKKLTVRGYFTTADAVSV